ncbi:hypothetical protein F66182_3377 [Fusarium sp. NRRL 66182]|nr:hypothetical protein F66182_3377 [Fusarium sp. NRRL 66182]
MDTSPLHGTACIGCRRRGRRCDRTLPTCLSCERRGVACEGYVTKWPGVAARGKLAGKPIPVADSSAAIAGIGSTLTRARQRQAKQNSTAKSCSRPVFDSIADEEIDKFVQHYVADLSSIFHLGNGPSENPMFHYILPLIDSVPPIRFALAGSASCHIAARNSDKALAQKSLRLRLHATHLLRKMLEHPNTVTDQTILASILVLAQLDMCSGDCTEFGTHLKAAVVIVRDEAYDGLANRYYFDQRLAWLDVMSSTTSARPPNLTREEVMAILRRFSSHGTRQWSYDVFPCPIELFEIISETTFLFKGQQATATPGQVGLQFEGLRDRVRGWKCPGMSGSRKHMVEAWRLGITAYLQRLFPVVNHEVDQVTALSRQVLDLAELIPPATTWSYAMLWPIFQVAVTLRDGELKEKEQIRRRLKIALEAIGCRHHSNALETLEVVWARREQYDPFTISMPGRTIMLV